MSTPPTPRRAWTKEEPAEYEEVAKLPLPPLSDTMAQYLDNIKPLVSDTVYQHTRTILDKFSAKDGVGEKVMMVLEERQEKLDNWAYDYWLNDMYLNQRLPLPVNFNPAMVLPRRKFSSHLAMLSYTARILHGFVSYKSRLDRRAVAQDRARDSLLCMAQYYRVLTTYRQPASQQDIQLSSGLESKESEQVVVGRRGHWYSLQVKTEGRWADLEDIYSGLLNLWDSSEAEVGAGESERVAYLTSTDRTTWAENFSQLAANQQNSDNLKVMADSLMFVCLDEETQNSSDCQRSLKEMFRQMMTGGGSRFNGSNRWYDKTVQLVVSSDGVSGLCYEHSASEGIVVIQLLENIVKQLDSRATQPIAYHPNNITYKVGVSQLVSHTSTVFQTRLSLMSVLSSVGTDGLNFVFRSCSGCWMTASRRALVRQVTGWTVSTTTWTWRCSPSLGTARSSSRAAGAALTPGCRCPSS